jgi:mRNA interferase MazF
MDSTEPRRSEIWLASLGAGRKGEPGKNRPTIVISKGEFLFGAADELVVVVPLSSSVAASPLRPVIGPDAGIDSPSAAICRAVRGIARSRLLRPLGIVDQEKMAEIERALGLVLGLV